MCNFSKKSEGKVTTNMFLYLSKKLIEMYRQKLIRIVGVKSPERTMGLGPHIEFDHVRGEGVGTKRAPGPILMGPKLFKRRSEETDVPNMAQTCTLPAIRIHSNEY